MVTTEEKENIIFYNGESKDGFAAALVLYIHFRDEASYIPISYNMPYGIYDSFDELIAISEYKNIYFVDCSLSLKEHLKLRDIANDILIIGHNENTRKHLETIPGAIFMQKSSSCVITWEFFMNSEPPKMLKLIENDELHIIDDDETKYFTYGLMELKEEFDLWLRYLNNENIGEVIASGKVIEKYMKGRVDIMKSNGIETVFKNKKMIIVSGDKMFLNEIYFYYKNHKIYDGLFYWYEGVNGLVYCFFRGFNVLLDINELFDGVVGRDGSATCSFKNKEAFIKNFSLPYNY